MNDRSYSVRFLPATTHKGTRFVVSDLTAGKRKIVSYDYTFSGLKAFEAALREVFPESEGTEIRAEITTRGNTTIIFA